MKPISSTSIRSAIALRQIMRQVIASGKITRADELVFFQALASDESFTDEDMALLQQVMKRMDMGIIKVVKD
ncbi:hypothetical protein [Pantanalinema sp. GBBB05]|uniref:hypothetical protein n=1 Tax=Pantanalinema sp. GBBB05 TaxID=2604139 RepID=UPI001D9F1AAD|nr:hypothetical protein [Pantanalinema sp. GBBB05]